MQRWYVAAEMTRVLGKSHLQIQSPKRRALPDQTWLQTKTSQNCNTEVESKEQNADSRDLDGSRSAKQCKAFPESLLLGMHCGATR